MNTYILLYKRWFKNRQRLIRATLIGVVALFLTTYYVLLNTFSLDVSQKTMIRLGESDYSTAIKVVSPGSKIPAKEIYKAIESGGAHPDSLRIQGWCNVDGVSVGGSHTGPIEVVGYREYLHGNIPAGRYRLLEGDMPVKSGDVAVSEKLFHLLPDKTKLTMWTGLSNHKVVGVISDNYDTNNYLVLAAPGTFQNMASDIPEILTRTYDDQIWTSWSGGNLDQVLENLESLSDRSKDELAIGTILRSEIKDSKSLTEEAPGLFLYPAILLSLMLSFLLVVLSLPNLRAQNAGLARIGVPKHLVTSAAATILCAHALLASICGISLGLILAFMARIWLMPHLLDHPVPAWPDLTPLWPILFIPSLTCLVLTWILLFHAGSNRSKQISINLMLQPWKVKWTDVFRWALATICTFCGIFIATTDRDLGIVIVAGLLFMLALLLVFVDIVRLSLIIPAIHLGSKLSHRLLKVYAKQMAVLAGVISLSLSLPLSIGVLFNSFTQSYASKTIIPQGQISIALVGEGDIYEQIKGGWKGFTAMLEEKTGLPKPVEINILETTGVDSEALDIRTGSIASVASITDIENVYQCEFSAEDKQKVKQGALVLLEDSGKALPDTPLITEGEHIKYAPTVSCGYNSPYSEYAASSVVLNSSEITKTGNPFLERLVYLNATDQQIQKTIQLHQEQHLSSAGLDTYKEPPPAQIATEILVAVTVLAISGLAVGFTITKALGQTLRTTLIKCRSLGFPRKMQHHIIFHHMLRLLLCVIPIAVAIAIAPTWILACTSKYFHFYMPTQYTIWGITLVILATILGITGVFKGLSPAKRQADGLL